MHQGWCSRLRSRCCLLGHLHHVPRVFQLGRRGLFLVRRPDDHSPRHDLHPDDNRLHRVLPRSPGAGPGPSQAALPRTVGPLQRVSRAGARRPDASVRRLRLIRALRRPRFHHELLRARLGRVHVLFLEGVQAHQLYQVVRCGFDLREAAMRFRVQEVGRRRHRGEREGETRGDELWDEMLGKNVVNRDCRISV